MKVSTKLAKVLGDSAAAGLQPQELSIVVGIVATELEAVYPQHWLQKLSELVDGYVKSDGGGG